MAGKSARSSAGPTGSVTRGSASWPPRAPHRQIRRWHVPGRRPPPRPVSAPWTPAPVPVTPGGVPDMVAKPNPRNHRNNPYAWDTFAAQVHHSAAGTLFRFRTELIILNSGLGAFAALAFTASWLWALVILTGVVVALFALPWTRRFVICRAWCVFSRHRLQRVFFETRMHTRS